jgi:hypothetical protein
MVFLSPMCQLIVLDMKAASQFGLGRKALIEVPLLSYE